MWRPAYRDPAITWSHRIAFAPWHSKDRATSCLPFGPTNSATSACNSACHHLPPRTGAPTPAGPPTYARQCRQTDLLRNRGHRHVHVVILVPIFTEVRWCPSFRRNARHLPHGRNRAGTATSSSATSRGNLSRLSAASFVRPGNAPLWHDCTPRQNCGSVLAPRPGDRRNDSSSRATRALSCRRVPVGSGRVSRTKLSRRPIASTAGGSYWW